MILPYGAETLWLASRNIESKSFKVKYLLNNLWAILLHSIKPSNSTIPVRSPLSNRLMATSSDFWSAALIRCAISRFRSIDLPKSCKIFTQIHYLAMLRAIITGNEKQKSLIKAILLTYKWHLNPDIWFPGNKGHTFKIKNCNILKWRIPKKNNWLVSKLHLIHLLGSPESLMITVQLDTKHYWQVAF